MQYPGFMKPDEFDELNKQLAAQSTKPMVVNLYFGPNLPAGEMIPVSFDSITSTVVFRSPGHMELEVDVAMNGS